MSFRNNFDPKRFNIGLELIVNKREISMRDNKISDKIAEAASYYLQVKEKD